MDSASDFGSGGWGFESPLGLFWKKSCANRESNPALKLGKLQCYRYTIGAVMEKKVFEARIELATSSVLDWRDNQLHHPNTTVSKGA